jgi:uncharacterized protein (DUF1778 family)
MATQSKVQRYEVQWDTETHELAERAATAAGFGSIKAYLSQLVRKDAARVLTEQAQITLTCEQYDRFAALCERSVAPNEKLSKAARTLDAKGFALDADKR